MFVALGFVELAHPAFDAFLRALPSGGSSAAGAGPGASAPGRWIFWRILSARALRCWASSLTTASLMVGPGAACGGGHRHFPLPLPFAFPFHAFAAGFATFRPSIWTRHAAARAPVDSLARAVSAFAVR